MDFASWVFQCAFWPPAKESHKLFTIVASWMILVNIKVWGPPEKAFGNLASSGADQIDNKIMRESLYCNNPGAEGTWL